MTLGNKSKNNRKQAAQFEQKCLVTDLVFFHLAEGITKFSQLLHGPV